MALIKVNEKNYEYSEYTLKSSGNKCKVCEKRLENGDKAFFSSHVGYCCSWDHLERALQEKFKS